MTKYILPIILLLASGFMYLAYIEPIYADIVALKSEEAKIVSALSDTAEIQSLREGLIGKYQAMSPDSLTRLYRLLPDEVDQLQLILDVNGIAEHYGMTLRGINISYPQGGTVSGTLPYDQIALRFNVSGPYEIFRSFIADLERSLALRDITYNSFSSSVEGTDDVVVYDYSVEIQSYWLKQ